MKKEEISQINVTFYFKNLQKKVVSLWGVHCVSFYPIILLPFTCVPTPTELQ